MPAARDLDASRLHAINRPLPFGAEPRVVEAVEELACGAASDSERRRRDAARPAPFVNGGPSFSPPLHFVEHGLAPDAEGVAALPVRMIKKKVTPVRRLDDAAVARTLPVSVRGNDGVARVLLPRAEQSARARDAQSVVARATAAGVARIEVIEPAAAAQDKRAFDGDAFPRRIVAQNLLSLAEQPRAVVGERLRVDRGRLHWARVVAVGLPDEEGLASFVAHERRVNRGDAAAFRYLADERAVIRVRPRGRVGRRDGDAERAALSRPLFAPRRVEDEEAPAVVHNLRCPEVALRPRRPGLKDVADLLPVHQIARAQQSEVRCPVARRRPGPVNISCARDRRVWVVARDDGVVVDGLPRRRVQTETREKDCGGDKPRRARPRLVPSELHATFGLWM